jgi:predicted metal-dependent peptidase
MSNFNPPRIVNEEPTDVEAANRLSLGFAAVLRNSPFFACILLKFLKVETTDIPTMGVDGIHLFYNPEFVKKLKMSELTGVLVHEVEHITFAHHLRISHRDPTLWNIAGDLVINNMLIKDRIYELPKDALLDKKYDGWHTEGVYNDILKDAEKIKQKMSSGASTGMVYPQMNPDGSQMSETDKEYAEGELKQQLAQAAAIAKRQGQLPSHLERLINELLEPKIDWKQYLHNFVKGKIMTDYTWAKGNRRYLAQDMYLPSVYSESPGEIVIAVDTSGSIGEKELAQFGGEIKAIVGDVKPLKTHVIYCDASVNKVDTFDQDDEISMLKGVGGGGTSFKPPFAWVEKMKIEPMAFIYLTDMYGDFPSKEPTYPVLWGSTTKSLVAPFGQTLFIDFQQK